MGTVYRTTTRQINDDLYNKFEEKSRKKGRSPSSMIEELIRLFVGDDR